MSVQGPETGFRCSAATRDLGEPRAGTASTVRAFVLLECATAWGVEALRDARLDDDVKSHLRRLERETGIRPLLIRRPVSRPAVGATGTRRSAPRGVRLFAAFARGARPWVETAVLRDVRDLLDLDLAPIARGTSVGLAHHADPLHLVCTHGRHDACCAERGRPLAAAFAAAAPEQSWEVSHIGGDRFAPNVLVLPDGLYYGGLEPDEVPGFVATRAAGRLDLEHLRGRAAYGFPVQAAEIHLRRHLRHLDIAPLAVTRHEKDGATHRVEFALAGRRWEVEVESTLGEPRQLTCSSTRPGRALEHRVVGLREV